MVVAGPDPQAGVGIKAELAELVRRLSVVHGRVTLSSG
ncbi:MAG: orotate phosphoribosyltransferase, partial [Mycobacterium sp.]